MLTDLKSRWYRLWSQRAAMGAPHLSPNDVEDVWGHLVRRYTESHRSYHTFEHLEACFGQFEHFNVSQLSQDQIELAVWFHDVVYDPRDTRPGGNELESMLEMRGIMPSEAWRDGEQSKVEDMVMATSHAVGKSPPSDPATRFLIDIDLAVLGQSAPRYENYRLAIRDEYRHVPEAEYVVGRGAVLRQFLLRSRIYESDVFFDRYETQARNNIEAEMKTLEGSG